MNTRKNTNKRGRRKNKNSGRLRRNRRGEQGGNLITRDNPRFPNDVKQIPIHNRVIRYLVDSASTDQGVTPADILRSVGYQINATATFYPIFGSIRLRRVSMYNVPSTGDFGDSSKELSFAWTGVQNAPNNLITDRGTATMPACIKCKPPKESVANMWFDVNSPTIASNLFVVTVPANTVIDIDFDFTIAKGTAPSTLTLSANSTLTGIGIITQYNTNGAWKPDGFPYIHV